MGVKERGMKIAKKILLLVAASVTLALSVLAYHVAVTACPDQDLMGSSCRSILTSQISSMDLTDRIIIILSIIMALSPLLAMFYTNIKNKTRPMKTSRLGVSDIFAQSKSKHILKRKLTNLMLVESDFLRFTDYVIQNSKYVHILNWDINYWDSWKKYENDKTISDFEKAHKHCNEIITSAKNRTNALGFDSLIIRIFIINQGDLQNRTELLKTISTAHQGTYSVFNKVYNEDTHPDKTLNIEMDTEFDNLILATDEKTGLNYIFAKCKEQTNEPDESISVFKIFIEGSSQYNKILQVAKPYFERSYDLRVIGYREFLYTLLDEYSKTKFDKTHLIDTVRDMLDKNELINHNTIMNTLAKRM